ncbi:MAG: DUF192 domain-containing protein [bacterium]
MTEGVVQVRNLSKSVVIVHDLEVAHSLRARMRGLLGRDGLEAGCGLWIRPCTSIHTIGMRFAIDAAFVDAASRVVRVYRALPPWRVTRIVWGAVGVLELAAGTLAASDTAVGDQLDLGTVVEAERARRRGLRGGDVPAPAWGPALGIHRNSSAALADAPAGADSSACREVLRFLPFSLDRSQRVPVYPFQIEPRHARAW